MRLNQTADQVQSVSNVPSPIFSDTMNTIWALSADLHHMSVTRADGDGTGRVRQSLSRLHRTSGAPLLQYGNPLHRHTAVEPNRGHAGTRSS